ncbi:hypothetical protein Sjap_024995 [Stephania japonica]|uniref:Uncharacterized protein n=1 Tax=Stephania japonica TaxID=461633 RepID=A0AAP0HF57_9MAGN
MKNSEQNIMDPRLTYGHETLRNDNIIKRKARINRLDKNVNLRNKCKERKRQEKVWSLS